MSFARGQEVHGSLAAHCQHGGGQERADGVHCGASLLAREPFAATLAAHACAEHGPLSCLQRLPRKLAHVGAFFASVCLGQRPVDGSPAARIAELVARHSSAAAVGASACRLQCCSHWGKLRRNGSRASLATPSSCHKLAQRRSRRPCLQRKKTWPKAFCSCSWGGRRRS